MDDDSKHHPGSTPQPSGQIDYARQGFVSRDALVEQLAQDLNAGDRPIRIIQAVAGAGKSMLAREYLSHLRATLGGSSSAPQSPRATVVFWDKNAQSSSTESAPDPLASLCEQIWEDPTHRVVVVQQERDRSRLPAALRQFPVLRARKVEVASDEGKGDLYLCQPDWRARLTQAPSSPVGATAETAARFEQIVRMLHQEIDDRSGESPRAESNAP